MRANSTRVIQVIFKRPVVCYNYPKAIKAFYMRENDDGKTVASMVCV